MNEYSLVVSFNDQGDILHIKFDDAKREASDKAVTWQKVSPFTDLEIEWNGDISSISDDTFRKIGVSLVGRLLSYKLLDGNQS